MRGGQPLRPDRRGGLFRPQIERLLRQRDAALADWRRRHPDRDAFEDRELEITSVADISVDAQIAAVAAALRSRRE